MFIGRFYHTIEAKQRVSLPKAFRDAATEWIITRGLDGGLFLFPAQTFYEQLKPAATRSFTKKHNRDFIRLMSNDAYAVNPDSNGRVQLPEYLTSFANLQKNVVIVGSGEYLELWDREQYHTYIEELEKRAEAVTEATELEINQES